MVQKLGRFGKYLKCNSCGATARMPTGGCRWRTSSEASADGEEEIEACELCGKQMQMKRGRCLAHSMVVLRLSRMQEHSQNFEERQEVTATARPDLMRSVRSITLNW